MFSLFIRENYANRNAFRILAISVLTIFLLLHSAISLAQETTILYDSTGNPVAYTSNDVLFNWTGDPVAFISSDGAIYNTQGKNLGWYFDGVLYDPNGYMVAFTPSAAPANIKITPTTKVVTITKESPTKTTIQTVIKKPTLLKEISPTPFSKVFIYEAPSP